MGLASLILQSLILRNLKKKQISSSIRIQDLSWQNIEVGLMNSLVGL